VVAELSRPSLLRSSAELSQSLQPCCRSRVVVVVAALLSQSSVVGHVVAVVMAVLSRLSGPSLPQSSRPSWRRCCGRRGSHGHCCHGRRGRDVAVVVVAVIVAVVTAVLVAVVVAVIAAVVVATVVAVKR
jgi:hypothetical protein